MDLALSGPLPNIELGCNLTVLAVTPDLVAVNKPSGIHSAPLSAQETSSILNAVIAIHPECAAAVGRKAGEGTLLHRLDRGTSGVLLFARSRESYAALRHLWEKRRLVKDYLAWVEGSLGFEGPLSLTLAHDPKSRRRMVALECLGAGARRVAARGRVFEAHTDVVVVKKARGVDRSHGADGGHQARDGGSSLVAVRIHTGVMHQVRVSLAALGHPVMGDPVYRAAGRAVGVGAVENGGTAGNSGSSIRRAQSLKELKHLTKDLAAIKGPNQVLLPHDGFFLHAWRTAVNDETANALARTRSLAPETLDVLLAGIECPPPIWFGARTAAR